jgi:hypothetical protein
MAYLFGERGNSLGNPNRETMIITPPTTDNVLVFPYDKSKNKFDRNFYSPVLTDGRASCEQLNHFLEKVERILKKKSRQVAIASCILAYVLFASIGVLIFSLMGGLDNLVEDEIDYDDPDTIFFMLFAVLFISFLSSFGFKAFVTRKDRKAQKKIKSLVEKSSQAFNTLGLRWNMPLRFPLWIELWKDYKGQYGYLPPLMPQNFNSYTINPNQGQTVGQRRNFQIPSNPQNYSNQQNYQDDTNITLQQPLTSQQRYPDFNQYTPLDA